MKETYLCTQISAYQTMLPTSLKIKTINLNGINIRKIYYPGDSKSYGDIRFYSKYYKKKNDIIIIIKDKKTKKKYYKKIVTFTEEVN